MTEDRNREDRFVVTDHERIRRLAESEGAEPVSVEGGDDSEAVRLRLTPDDRDGERLAWGEFFDRFERDDRAVQYRPGERGAGSEAVLEVVDRSTRTMPVSDDEPGASPHAVDGDPIADDPRGDTDRTVPGRGGPADPDDRPTSSPGDDQKPPTEDPDGIETEPLATGDTGDAEPVAFERTEDDDAGTPDEPSTAATADTERAPTAAAEGLVLDELHEHQSGLGSGPSDEYLVFENAGDRSIDLAGWTVENEAGRSYRFPSGTVLDPGERLTLHSEAGEDDEGHRYWGVEEPVWGDKEVTVTVRDATGERVLRERYET